MFHDIHEIFQKAPIMVSLGKFPSKKRPEEYLWNFPHLVFQKMQETCYGYKHDPGISFLPEINVPADQNYYDKSKSMSKKSSTCKNIFKKDPANGLIYQVRQQGSQCNEAIIKMFFERRKCKACKEEYDYCHSNMAKDEHCEPIMIYPFKRLHINSGSLWGDF